MADQKPNEFHISLEGIELSDEQISRIEKGIHEVVLREITPIKDVGENAFIVKKFPDFIRGEVTLGMWWPDHDSILKLR